MATEYQYLEPSTHEEDEPVQQEQQETSIVTIEEEQNVENESTKLKLLNADAFIQAEIKEVICKKETTRTTSIVLKEQLNNIVERIRHVQVLENKAVEENESLDINSAIEKQELMDLQKRVLYNGEIVNRLLEFMSSVKIGIKQIKPRTQQTLRKITTQKENIVCHNNKISQLKSQIDKEKVLKKDDTNPYKKECLILKAKITERQEYLQKLIESRQQREIQKDNINRLINEREKIKTNLDNSKKYLKELMVLKAKKEEDINETIEKINLEREERNKRLTDAVQATEDINRDINQIADEKNSKERLILQKDESLLHLQEKRGKLAASVEDKKVDLDLHNQNCKNNIVAVQERLRKSEVALTDLIKQNEDLRSSLELLKQQWISKVEEQNNKLLIKINLEKKLMSDEVLLTNIKQLDDQIAHKKKRCEELSEKNRELSVDQCLLGLKKEKAFLEASTDYLTEKLESVQKEWQKRRDVVNNVQTRIDIKVAANIEKQEKCAMLLTELEELNDNKASEDIQRSVTPTSILKTSFSKKTPISPKKVQFEGLSSFESSVSSDEPTQYSGSTQSSIKGKTFDDLLQEIHAENFKKPVKVPSRRKLDLE